MKRTLMTSCFALSLLAATPAGAEDICGPDAYVESLSQKQGREIIICACAPGYERTETGCERNIPATLTRQAWLFIPQSQSGTINAYISDKGQQITAETDRMFFANIITTDAQSALTAYLDQDLRLRMGAQTKLKLAPYAPDAGLHIRALSGLIRLDTTPSPQDRQKLSAFYARAGSFARHVAGDPLVVTTPAGTISLTHADAVIEARPNGDVLVHVLAGDAILQTAQDKSAVTLKPGDSGLLRNGAAPRLLARNQTREITQLWQNR